MMADGISRTVVEVGGVVSEQRMMMLGEYIIQAMPTFRVCIRRTHPRPLTKLFRVWSMLRQSHPDCGLHLRTLDDTQPQHRRMHRQRLRGILGTSISSQMRLMGRPGLW